MAHFEINGRKIFIDNRLKEQLDKKIIPELKRKDMDAVFAVDGRERIGKSVFAMGFGAYISYVLKTNFDLSNICLNPLEFRDKVEKAKKNEVVIYDEAHRGMGSSSALSEINKLIKDLMMEMGQKNLTVLVVMPTFFLLERYVALFRTRGLFHIYTNKRNRGYWVYFNEKNKKFLYMKGKKEFNYNCMSWPFFRGRFMNSYPIDEEQYRKKKAKSFKEGFRRTRKEVSEDNVIKFAPLLKNEFNLTMDNIDSLFKYYDIKRSRSRLASDCKVFDDRNKKNIPS